VAHPGGGLPPDFAPSHTPSFRPVPDQETASEIARRAVEAGAYVAIAHPQWSGLSLDDARELAPVAHAVETYNHGCAVGCDRPDGFHTLDLLLSEGHRLDLCATDDAHFYEPDHFGGWVMVKAEANEPEALLGALKAGAYYSSQGPEIRGIEVTAEGVQVECSAAASIVVSGPGNGVQGDPRGKHDAGRHADGTVPPFALAARDGGRQGWKEGLVEPHMALSAGRDPRRGSRRCRGETETRRRPHAPERESPAEASAAAAVRGGGAARAGHAAAAARAAERRRADRADGRGGAVHPGRAVRDPAFPGALDGPGRVLLLAVDVPRLRAPASALAIRGRRWTSGRMRRLRARGAG
jgi:hypothetical protein